MSRTLVCGGAAVIMTLATCTKGGAAPTGTGDPPCGRHHEPPSRGDIGDESEVLPRTAMTQERHRGPPCGFWSGRKQGYPGRPCMIAEAGSCMGERTANADAAGGDRWAGSVSIRECAPPNGGFIFLKSARRKLPFQDRGAKRLRRGRATIDGLSFSTTPVASVSGNL